MEETFTETFTLSNIKLLISCIDADISEYETSDTSHIEERKLRVKLKTLIGEPLNEYDYR